MKMRAGMRVRDRWREDRGSSLIEFALISFMFIILLTGIVEMGRMVLVYTTIANAARAGARYAIVHGADQTVSPSGPGNPCTCPDVKTVVKNFASGGLLSTSALTITVSYPDGDNQAGSHVTVKVMYAYDPFVNYFATLLNKTLGSTSQGVITY
jgi:Flp pilus assembly protein TadG